MSDNIKKEIIIITGPTASGKSNLAIKLAKKIDGVIVSADSRQIYEECIIGTARVTEEELGGVECLLSGHKKISDEYSVGAWLKESKEAIDKILQNGKTPIIAGGTPFYIHSLLNGIFSVNDNIKVPENLREELNEKWELNQEAIYEELLGVDENWANKVEKNDRQRVLRGLEYFYIHKAPLSEALSHNINIFKNYNFKLFILTSDRKELYDKINLRVDLMIKDGLEKEVYDLYKKYGDFAYFNSLKTVGYIEWIDFFRGLNSREEVIELIKRNSRRYAKRQITFFKNKFPQAKYIDMNDKDFFLEYFTK